MLCRYVAEKAIYFVSISSCSSVGVEGAMSWQTLKPPPHPPDCNPCDFGLWSMITRTMEQHEDEGLKGAPEKPADYWERLGQTAADLGEAPLRKLCGSMGRRMLELKSAKGAYIKNG